MGWKNRREVRGEKQRFRTNIRAAIALVEIFVSLRVTYTIYHNRSIVNPALWCLYSGAKRYHALGLNECTSNPRAFFQPAAWNRQRSPGYTGIETQIFNRNIMENNYISVTYSIVIYKYEYIENLINRCSNDHTFIVILKKKMQILWGLALYFLITCIGTE